MAISDRITSIEEHIKESYQELEGIGIDTTGVNNNLENIPKLIDGYWETLPKVTGEGTSITLDNTKEGKMKIDLKGNTSQYITTGANLLPQDKYITTTTINGIAYTNNGDGTFNLSGTANANTIMEIIPNGNLQLEANQSYYLYSSVPYNGTTFNMSIPMIYNGTTKYLKANNTYTPTTTPTNERLQFYIRSGQSINQTNIKLMLVKGSIAPTDYEPYTNGASPNPDYPQDIHVVSGDNTINICGKNLFDDSIVTNLWSNYSTQEIIFLSGANLHKFDCKQGDIFTLSATFESAGGNGAILIQFFDKNGNNLGRSAVSNNTTLTLTRTAPLNTSYAYIGRYFATPTTIQLEKNTQATTYEEYKGASYPINLGVENLFDTSLLPMTKNGVTISKDDEGNVVLNGTPTITSGYIGFDFTLSSTYLKAGTYTSSIKNKIGGIGITINQTTPGGIINLTMSDTVNSKTGTLTADLINGTIGVNVRYDVGTLTNFILNPQLEIGSKAHKYTPYGTTPIELCKIGDYQDKIAKSTGKNLFDKSTITTSAYLKEDGTLQTGTGAEYVTSDFIPVKPNTTYYKTLTLSPRTKFYDANKQVLDNTTYQDVSIGGNAGSFTTPSNAYYFRFTGNVNTSTGININLTMINEGTTALPYEPYGKVWYVNKQIGKVVLNGSESGGRILDNNQRIAYNSVSNPKLADVFIDTPDSVSNLTPSLSTHFSPTMQGRITATNNSFGFSQWGGQKYIYISAIYDNIEDFKNWLSTHNTTVYYVLATPTYTEITDSTLISQLNALAKSYASQTNISQESNDLASLLNATALSE